MLRNKHRCSISEKVVVKLHYLLPRPVIGIQNRLKVLMFKHPLARSNQAAGIRTFKFWQIDKLTGIPVLKTVDRLFAIAHDHIHIRIRQCVFNQRQQILPLHFGCILKLIDHKMPELLTHPQENERHRLILHHVGDQCVEITYRHNVTLFLNERQLIIYLLQKQGGMKIIPHDLHELQIVLSFDNGIGLCHQFRLDHSKPIVQSRPFLQPLTVVQSLPYIGTGIRLLTRGTLAEKTINTPHALHKIILAKAMTLKNFQCLITRHFNHTLQVRTPFAQLHKIGMTQRPVLQQRDQARHFLLKQCPCLCLQIIRNIPVLFLFSPPHYIILQYFSQLLILAHLGNQLIHGSVY